MKVCECNSYDHLEDYESLKKRYKESKNIINKLDFISEHPAGEHRLYRCKICGQIWQRSLCWMDGNKEYIFKVEEIELLEWISKPFVQPDDLFVRSGRVQQYLSRARFEETKENCKYEGCSNHSVKLSIFCVIHHMENIGINISMPDSNTWFPPYRKENFELTFERVSKLPCYKALQ